MNQILDFFKSNTGVNILESLLVLVIAFFIVRIMKMFLKRILKSKGDNKRLVTISKLIRNSLGIIIYFIALLVILPFWGVDVTAIIASAGIIGLAFGFGAQKFIQDLINGLFIIIEKHYQVGDIVEINGFKGEITLMGIRTTRIKSWKGEVKTINNGDITNSINYSVHPSVGIVDIGIAYSSDLKKVRDVVETYLDTYQDISSNIVERPQFLGVNELADSAIVLRIIFKSNPNQHFALERKFREDLSIKFRENAIEIPFPQVTVHYEE